VTNVITFPKNRRGRVWWPISNLYLSILARSASIRDEKWMVEKSDNISIQEEY
jgi:hypothetical protein